jgi:hypothetical protein
MLICRGRQRAKSEQNVSGRVVADDVKYRYVVDRAARG